MLLRASRVTLKALEDPDETIADSKLTPKAVLSYRTRHLDESVARSSCGLPTRSSSRPGLKAVAVRYSGSGGIPMAVGKVKWFNDEKGWGFIKQDNGPDVFVHYSQISGDGRRRLFEDEMVEFEIKEGPKGLQAINVVRQAGASAMA